MMNLLNKKISSLIYIMILGQKLKNLALQLGNKSIGAIHTLGTVKEIHSNLEKLVQKSMFNKFFKSNVCPNFFLKIASKS